MAYFILLLFLSINGASYGGEITYLELRNAVEFAQPGWDISPDPYRDFIPGLSDEVHLEAKRLGPLTSSPAMPRKLDWRTARGQNFLPPVRNQGRCGSCVAFAALGVMETQVNITSGMALNMDLSEQHLFSRIGRCDRGSMPWFAAVGLKRTGVVDESCLPYTSGRLGEDVASAEVCAQSRERTYKVTSYSKVARKSIKAALQHGPVLTTMIVYEDFLYYRTGVYRHLMGKRLGGHAVVIVGYDDDDRAWIVRNSWGALWGDQGYFKIGYENESSLGALNYRFTVEPMEAFARFHETYGMGRLAGSNQRLPLVVFGNPGPLSGSLRSITLPNQEQVPVRIQDGVALVDVADLSRGIYELSLTNGSRSFAQFSRWIVMNEIVSVPLRLSSSFESPASGRGRFIVEVPSDAPPVSAVFFQVFDENSQLRSLRLLTDPGMMAATSWYSTDVPDGDYFVRAVGYTGSLVLGTSKILELQVRNNP